MSFMDVVLKWGLNFRQLKQMFFGSGAYGTLVAKVAMEGMGVRESDADQTERMLQNSSAASQSVQGMYGTTNP
jgi:hypothetical protein